LVCAAGHNPSQAPAIAKKLYAQSKAPATRAAAVSILAKTEPKIVEQAILDDDVRLQKAAVDAASPAVLAGLLPKLPDTAKVFALRVIDSEKDALDHVAVKGEAVRVAALEALGRVGTGYSVAALIKAATSGTELEKNAAVASLALVNGQGAAEAIERQAGQGESASRVLAINALAARAAKSSLRTLLQYGADPDAAVSKAALAAIGKIGGDESLDGLVKLVYENKPGAKDALQAVANRSANKSAVGQRLAAQAQAASGSQLSGILDVMALVGGADSLAAVVKFATTGNDEAKDAGIRALCQWREFSAVKPLLDVLAAPGTKQVHNVLAIQAVCRLVKAEENKDTAQARVDATLAALKAAGRPQEKTQALSALAAIKDRKAADAIIKLLADAATQTDAATAALSLADGLRKQDRGSAKKLAEAVKKANLSPALNKKAEESLNKK
jgi:HEAT repeat protein